MTSHTASLSERLQFYRTTATMTDSGSCAASLEGLPVGLGEIARVVQGLLLHEHIAPAYGVELSESRRSETHTRSVESMLTLVQAHDARPLTETRSLESRTIGTCRNFTTLAVAILRNQGTPARARCGFGAYFEAGQFVDHWVVEYWNKDESRWVRVDTQIDDLQRGLFIIDFNLLDVPHDRFLIAADAWKRARTGEVRADQFGIMDMRGEWFIAGNLVRDAAALNNMEMLPWDCWGAMPEPGATLNDEQRSFFDQLATLTAEPDAHFAELRALYTSGETIRVPGTVFNAVLNRPESI